jgi:hypothetical protein
MLCDFFFFFLHFSFFGASFVPLLPLKGAFCGDAFLLHKFSEFTDQIQ